MKRILLLLLASSGAISAAQAPLRPIKPARTPLPLKNLLLQEIAHKSTADIQNLIQRVPADLYLDLAAVLLFANGSITIPLLERKQLLELMSALTPDHNQNQKNILTYLAQCLEKSHILANPEELANHGPNAIINKVYVGDHFSPSKKLTIKKYGERSWLTQAIADNNLLAVWFLLENSADPNRLTQYIEEAISPLSVAVLNNNIPALQLLLNNNTALDHPAYYPYTQPLFIALKNNQFDVANFIYAQLKNPLDYLNTTYNIGSNSGITMLDALTLYKGRSEQALQWLRDHGAVTNYINSEEQ